jgi:hypothetical protein
MNTPEGKKTNICCYLGSGTNIRKQFYTNISKLQAQKVLLNYYLDLILILCLLLWSDHSGFPSLGCSQYQ